MAYTAPTVDASGQTWAQLQTRGFSGHIRALVAALSTNPATFDAKQEIGELLNTSQADLVFQRAKCVVDNYLNGKSDKASAKTQVFDLQLAFASVAAALGEIGVLIDAN